jgi:hypothetical protein
VEDKISGFEDKVDIIEKPDEYVETRMKKFERNIQEL